MSNVLIDKTKLDALAVSVAEKSGKSVPLNIDKMREAVNGISGGANLQTKSETYTPTTSQQTDTITPDAGYDGMDEVDITINAVPTGEMYAKQRQGQYYTDGTRKWRINSTAEITEGDGYGHEGYITDNTVVYSDYAVYNAVASGTSVTPTESAQTIGGSNYMMEGAVTVNAIPSNYVGSGITQRTSSDLTASNLTVTAPSGYYSSSATKTLTDANLSAENIKKNVTIFNVTGTYEGESGGLKVKTATATPVSASSSISFSVDAEPTSFVICSSANLSTGASPYKTASVVFDGSNIFGQYITNSSNANVTYDGSGFSKSYNNGTLTVTGTGTNFQANEYTLVYTYGGSADTKDVQVGSGATSIAFTDLEDEPSYFSCVFKSNFGTSSGYQRVISVVYDGTDTYGLAMDSSAKAQTTWSYTYNNGTLTISSNGTNSGGYFHQPGYYQLTYAVGGSGNYQTKTVTPSTSDQNITADAGYDALKKVVIEGDADLIASNIKSGVSIFGVTGSYDGGGGLTLLGTSPLGSLSTSSTSASDTGKSFTINSVTDYDVLVVDISVGTVTNSRHIGTISMVYLTGTSNVDTKNTVAVGSNKWNIKAGSTGTKSTRQSSTAYGIYINAGTLNNGNITMTVYYRYNSNNTGTINGSYTAHVYGLKLVDLV